MSGTNTKANKIDRLLARQISMDEDLTNIFSLIRLGHETDQETIRKLTATNTLLAEVAHSLEAENSKLRKYLGSELFARRQRDVQIPTLGLCYCPPGTCRGDKENCRHPAIEPHTHTLEPKWVNRPDPVPHNTKGTI